MEAEGEAVRRAATAAWEAVEKGEGVWATAEAVWGAAVMEAAQQVAAAVVVMATAVVATAVGV